MNNQIALMLLAVAPVSFIAGWYSHQAHIEPLHRLRIEQVSEAGRKVGVDQGRREVAVACEEKLKDHDLLVWTEISAEFDCYRRRLAEPPY
jgi:hypothetical protein